MRPLTKKKPTNYLLVSGLFVNIVRPKGLEPLSLVPETKILSIELRAQKTRNKSTPNILPIVGVRNQNSMASAIRPLNYGRIFRAANIRFCIKLQTRFTRLWLLLLVYFIINLKNQ